MTGRFIWYELMTSDVEAASAFYCKVVGWSCQQSAVTEQEYMHLQAGECGIGGIMAMPAMAANAGMNPTWLGYISVPDIDVAADAIKADGGAKYMDQTIPNTGRFATMSDPQGRPFYIMTPAMQGRSEAFKPRTPGHVGWHEYRGKDGEAAFAFYTQHFGWPADGEMDMGPMGKYQMFQIEDAQAGGIMRDDDFPNKGWLFYFNVADINAAKALLEAEGGTVFQGPHKVPDGQWILMGKDPQGAVFALVAPQ
jgi:uncharacterized protein